MQIGLRLAAGDWGQDPLTTETLAREVVGTFASGLPKDGRIDILLERRRAPMAVSSRLSERGEYLIHLGCAAIYWSQFTYQLGHEFTHVLANSLSFTIDRYAWFEESLCETGSLFALRRLATAWKSSPPYPHWGPYHSALSKYVADHLAQPARSLPAGARFERWFEEHLPLLEMNHVLRDHNTIVARHLLPVFERDPSAWRAIRYLHRFARPSGMDFAGFASLWRATCPEESRGAVESIAEVLGISARTPYTPSTRRTGRRTDAQKFLTALRFAIQSRNPPAQRENTASRNEDPVALADPATDRARSS
jgi:hypothetical protein